MSLPNVTETAVASSRSLCVLATVKTELGISDESQDTKLNRLIRSASAYVARELGRPPWLQTYLERRAGDGGVYLYLSRWPVQTVASVTQGTGSSPATVDSGDYSVAQPARDRLYKAGGWTQTDVDEASISPGSRALEYNVTYTAGWVMPTEVTDWADSTAIAAGGWVRSAADPDHPLIFQATGAATLATPEPTWPTVVGGTVTHGGTTFTGYAQATPFDLEEAAMMLVIDWYDGGLRVPGNIAEEGGEGWRIKYRERSRGVSDAVSRLIGGYK